MITSKKNVLDGLLSGRLQATTTLISDSVVQPGLLLFRELIATKLERCAIVSAASRQSRAGLFL